MTGFAGIPVVGRGFHIRREDGGLMPYPIRKTEDGKYQVVDPRRNKVLGTHDSMEQAAAQVRAIYHSEREKREG